MELKIDVNNVIDSYAEMVNKLIRENIVLKAELEAAKAAIEQRSNDENEDE